ncbi:xaa-Pro aminopeptidase 1 [Anoplophora glabripennis]|uniref:xaa-Pro aminopeptidase 1 n=1 Tax=Anoplophora glabripennis TaxID=217634 RepID=UPI0008747667|nr:xaa-Pro aminopeptidase 1 [Anoplophora glabripennis]XP_018573805.1 xaa-Pro aminopeptidase 1 [Anoplophora glabripennis]XP_018573806.1 xaa-Pro aminopeptidase 1 [Anoplophora glabripennis]
MPPKSTTKLLTQLRALMQNTKYVSEPIHAYIVPSNDAHTSEYLADCDQYRAYISGFTGSAGTAIITHNEACLWTDGRYFLQASQQLDSNWTLMKEGLASTPTEGAWLSKSLPSGSRVGVDPKVFAFNNYMPLSSQLEAAGHKLIPVSTNLIELLWTERPKRPTNPVIPLPLKYSGRTVKEKLESLQGQMREKDAKYLLLAALDEIAYFLNLRGSDIQYNPVFFSYVIVSLNGFTVFVNPKQNSSEIKQHLTSEAGNIYTIEPYDKIEEKLKNLVNNLDGTIWFSEATNYALISLIPKKNLLLTNITPIQLMKAIKNSVEINGMRNAHIKDAAALCCYFSWLEKNVTSSKITEISGAKKLLDFRKLQEDFVGESFSTISSVGPHGAIIHYSPDETTDVQITNSSLYLCDSGGQFKDGTTDVTRTLHFGTPTEFERECYTRVLKGHIKIATSVFPRKIKGNYLDSFAREYLWQVGLDYAHGTGHGIGSYLNVHEGPMGISWKPLPDDPGLEAGMFISNEPGYYQDGEFGIRIEDIIQIVDANPPHNFNNKGYLTFDSVTLVPKIIKLIIIDMLTDAEIDYLNKYHQQCRDVVGPLLQQQGQQEALEWLIRETQPISR